MNILIIGANGQIGQKLVKKLKNTSDQPVAMVRDQQQKADLEAKGISAVFGDLEKDFDHAFDGVNAVVFTAGSGGHTGPDKTHLVDRIGAKKAIDLAVKNKVDRFIMVSALGADYSPSEWPDSMKHYYEAKADADKHLMQSQLNYTILKPGRLTNEEATNNISIGEKIDKEANSITRTDVATVIQKIVNVASSYGKSYELLNGPTPIDAAIEAL